MKYRTRFLPRTVLILGLVSFFNDIASEMITPLLPLFLTITLGAGTAAVGLIEGVAEATSSVVKWISGKSADRKSNHKGLVLTGYGVSNIARPLIGFAFGWIWVLLLRFLDRVGKGIRTAPRDALVADATSPEIRGRAFGFHRAMDHAGATVGPLVAFLLLSQGLSVRQIFLFSFFPGLVLMSLIALGIPKKTAPVRTEAKHVPWRSLDRRLRVLILTSGGLAFATAPEAFLVLWANARGLEIVWVPLLWAAAHAVRMITSGAGGWLSDRFERLPVVIAGWSMRVGLLIALAVSSGGQSLIWLLFLLYAGTTSATEGAERALIGDAAPAGQRGAAFGIFHMINGLMVLPGAILFGLIWQEVGMTVSFLMSAGLSLIAAITLSIQMGKK